MMETAVAPITLNLVRERFLWDMAKERLPTHRDHAVGRIQDLPARCRCQSRCRKTNWTPGVERLPHG
jgi:hypothetical protein